MSRLQQSDSIVFDVQPRDKEAHSLWSKALTLQEERIFGKSQEKENLINTKEVFEKCRNKD